MVLAATKMASKKVILIISLFSILLSFPVIRSGIETSNGIYFWGPNGHDGVWHLALINHIQNPFKIVMPTFSGLSLKNYHPFFDILISFLSKITFIDSSVWLFLLSPILMSFVYLWLSYQLAYSIRKKSSDGIIFIFLNTFSTSFGWIAGLIKDGHFGGESMFWAMQSYSTQINPPFALSLIFIFIILKIINSNNFSIKKSFYVLFLLIILPITKVYGAFAAYIIFATFSLVMIFNKKYLPVLTLLTSIIPAYLIFSIYNQTSSGLIKFQPFWFLQTMVESPDRFYVPFLANMRYTLESSGIIGPRLIALYLLLFFVFITGNYSWRLLSIFRIKHRLVALILPSVFIMTLIPIFFVQKGTTWNTIQFIYYPLVFLNLPLALFLSDLKKIKYLILFLIFIANISTFQNYFGYPAPAYISSNEIEALNFLKKQPKGITLTFPYDSFLKKSLQAPVPLYAYETTSYVAAYSRQLTFLEDEMNLQNSGYDWQKRRTESEKFFKFSNIHQDRGFLVNNQIDYIYLNNQQIDYDISTINGLYTEILFKNPSVTIYKVLR